MDYKKILKAYIKYIRAEQDQDFLCPSYVSVDGDEIDFNKEFQGEIIDKLTTKEIDELRKVSNG